MVPDELERLIEHHKPSCCQSVVHLARIVIIAPAKEGIRQGRTVLFQPAGYRVVKVCPWPLQQVAR